MGAPRTNMDSYVSASHLSPAYSVKPISIGILVNMDFEGKWRETRAAFVTLDMRVICANCPYVQTAPGMVKFVIANWALKGTFVINETVEMGNGRKIWENANVVVNNGRGSIAKFPCVYMDLCLKTNPNVNVNSFGRGPSAAGYVVNMGESRMGRKFSNNDVDLCVTVFL